jgi:hypothetical protein
MSDSACEEVIRVRRCRNPWLTKAEWLLHDPSNRRNRPKGGARCFIICGGTVPIPGIQCCDAGHGLLEEPNDLFLG